MTSDSATVDSEARSRAASLDDARRHHEMLASCRRYVVAVPVIWMVVGVIEVLRGQDQVEMAQTVGVYRVGALAFAAAPIALVLWRPVGRRELVALMGLLLAVICATLLAMCAVDRERAEIYPFRLLVTVASMGITMPIRAYQGVWIHAAYGALTLVLFGALTLAIPSLREALALESARVDVLGAVPLMLVGSMLAVWSGDWAWHTTQAWLRTTDLGRYTLRHKLGAGGMGEVWVAWHARFPVRPRSWRPRSRVDSRPTRRRTSMRSA